MRKIISPLANMLSIPNPNTLANMSPGETFPVANVYPVASQSHVPFSHDDVQKKSLRFFIGFSLNFSSTICANVSSMSNQSHVPYSYGHVQKIFS